MTSLCTVFKLINIQILIDVGPICNFHLKRFRTNTHTAQGKPAHDLSKITLAGDYHIYDS